ncbi:unnamed protein product, partial [Notodromas monacha]
MTYRAVATLMHVDVILAEDTRNAQKLLQHYGIQKPVTAYHMHNEHAKTNGLIDGMKSGTTYGLITDAGTPGISDPGYLLAKACIENHLNFESLPGATALIPGLILSGFPNHHFSYYGFLPVKKGRQTVLNELSTLNHTVVLYESPHKIHKTLSDLSQVLGEDTPACLARELTKKFEDIRRGTLGDLSNDIAD